MLENLDVESQFLASNPLPDGKHRCMQAVALLDEYARERFGAAKVEAMDGDTPAAARHDAVERFNAPDAPGFLFLCATRCCGLGTNLPTIAAVVLFDSDWDARSDIQVSDGTTAAQLRGL